MTSASALVKATEALIEAALKDGAAQMSTASKDSLVELRHIHSAADKLCVAVERAEAGTAQKLEQARTDIVQKLGAVEAAIKAQTRTLSLQAALSRADTDTFIYFESGRSYSSSGVVRPILKHALAGSGTWLSADATYSADEKYDYYSKGTQQAYRDKLVAHLHGMTGIKPTLELDQDGKRYVIRL